MRVNIGDIVSNRARRDPNLEALVDTGSGERYTYAQVNTRINRTAHMLMGLGVKPGDRVALLLMNGAPFYEAYLACAKLGAVIVPVNWRLVPDELAYILDDAGAETLIFETEFAALAQALHAGGKTKVSNWLQVASDTALEDFAQDYKALAARGAESEPPRGAFDDDNL